MGWFLFLILFLCMLFDAWAAGISIQKKNYGIAFIYIILGLFCLGVLIIQFSIRVTF